MCGASRQSFYSPHPWTRGRAYATVEPANGLPSRASGVWSEREGLRPEQERTENGRALGGEPPISRQLLGALATGVNRRTRINCLQIQYVSVFFEDCSECFSAVSRADERESRRERLE